MSVQKSPVMMLMLVLFVALVGATVWRIMTALETHPGLVVADAYETGERYGDTLKKRDALIQQGWKLELTLPEPITHGVKKTSDGAYQVETTLPLKGRWDLLVEITKGDFLQQDSARMFAQ